ncbi:hypothetical protein CDL12_22566 [Handroanthus impetiginosus]|uniref:Uncharacterized protein n=1 Tax=Handroanthus impetiginosus TaxID=429701 RepID=A0A2G9GI78_9LAMI|nr:hypothetical protein CDL12_22566 [Handroanthus impetiginosus]
MIILDTRHTVVGKTDTSSNTIKYALAEVMNKPEVLRKVSATFAPGPPLLVPHCPSNTSNAAGYTIPKGALVFVNIWAIHRGPSIWDNPLEFYLERFLDGKWDYSGNNFCYFPFRSGQRICARISMAERMFMYSLASLVHSFEWNLPAGERMDLSEKFGIVLEKKMPLIAIPTPRLSNPSLYE